MMSSCPPREQLELLTRKQLGPNDQTAVETHVSGCSACHNTLASLQLGVTEEWQFGQRLQAERLEKLPTELRDHPRYRVTGVLGQGGMGTVYKAEHRLLDRPVVLKAIRPELLDNPGVVLRFEREAKLAARLSHSNIVAVYEAEQLERTQLLVMEFVEGVNLAELVAQRGLLPVAETCELVRQAAIGLQHIHEHKLPEEAFRWYLEIRKYGTVPHAGFGMGIERVVSWLGGVRHLREAIPYPRMLHRLYP